jgi:hypothetical protein
MVMRMVIQVAAKKKYRRIQDNLLSNRRRSDENKFRLMRARLLSLRLL